MARAGSRVGSLYYQILVDGSGVEKESQKIRKSISNVNKFLKRDAQDRLDTEQGINKQYAKLFDDIRVVFKNNQEAMTQALDAAERERLQMIAKYQEKERKLRQKKIEDKGKVGSDNRFLQHLDKHKQEAMAKELQAVKEIQDSKAAWLRKNVSTRVAAARAAERQIAKSKGREFFRYLQDHKRENIRLLKVEEDYYKRRAAIQRKWDRRRRRNAKSEFEQQYRDLEAALQKRLNMQKTKKSLGAGIESISGKMIGRLDAFREKFSNTIRAVGEFTVALFILEQALGRVARFMGMVFNAMKSLAVAADNKKKQMVQLTTLFAGQADVASNLREELVKYSAATAFSVDQTMSLAVQLRALGFAAGEIVPSIKAFGKLSFGDPAKMKLIAKAFSDVKAQGKLMQTEVRQFANQGVPLLIELQERLGISALELRDRIKDGLVGFDEVDEAIKSIADRFGAIDQVGLSTYEGRMEAVAEKWEEVKIKLGEMSEIQDAFLELAETLDKTVTGLDRILDALDKLQMSSGVNIFKEMLESVVATIPALNKLYTALKLLDKLQDPFGTKEDEQKLLDEVYKKNQKKKEDARQTRIQEEKIAQAEATRQERYRRFMREQLEHQAKMAKAAGNDSLAKQLEEQKRLEDARQRAIGDEVGQKGIDRYVQMEKDLIAAEKAAEIEKKKIENAEKQNDEFERMLEMHKKRQDEERKLFKEFEESIRKAKKAAADEEIKKAEESVKAFRDRQNKLDPQASPKFDPMSVAEYQFLKNKQLQAEKIQEEKRQKAEEREFLAGLNERLMGKLDDLLGFGNNDFGGVQ